MFKTNVEYYGVGFDSSGIEFVPTSVILTLKKKRMPEKWKSC